MTTGQADLAPPEADPFRSSGWNPMAGNPLVSRADVEAALKALVAPLGAFVSQGGARVRLAEDSAHFDRAAADFEGFARPLWGLAPAAVGGADWIDWATIRRGLVNGTDPGHAEYWGKVKDLDQRMVELAAVGFALRLVPDRLWAPLNDAARAKVATYLLDARVLTFSGNNWKFFRLMIDLGLEEIGVPFDPAPSERYLDELDALYLGEGWYRDGAARRVDHYIPFAMHFYGLLLAAYGRRDARNRVFRERANLFAPDFRRWFADDGAAIPFGRSMTYRFAMGAFWGALAVAGEEALPWGTVKGYFLRHLRWWSGLPIADRDGVLSIGYGYPQRMMSEHYNSAGSPYWALKAFVPLALPAEHPFWQAREEAAPAFADVAVQRQPGWLVSNPRGDAVALSGGQQNLEFRHGPEKYAKFAYSARYGFSIEADERRFADAAFDGMLGFSDDGRHYRVRETNEEVLIADGVLYARWRPWADVEVETWLLPRPPGHLRLHLVRTPRPLRSCEGGFAMARTDGDRDRLLEVPGGAAVWSTTDLSGIRALGTGPARTARVHRALPNTNLMSARSWVPQLLAELPAGETTLGAFVVASPDASAALQIWRNPPTLPNISPLRMLLGSRGERVGAMSGLGDR